MKKTLIAIVSIIMLAIVVVPSAQAGNQDKVHFGFKSASLTPHARQKLDSLALDLKHLSSVMVTSYVPKVGDVALNQEFATKRVKTVKDYLVTQGVNAAIISTQTIDGPPTKSRMVEMSYGGSAAPAAPMTPPPAATPPPPPASEPQAFTPPPAAEEPVITAAEKTYESGVTEEDLASGGPNKTPSRWDY